MGLTRIIRSCIRSAALTAGLLALSATPLRSEEVDNPCVAVADTVSHIASSNEGYLKIWKIYHPSHSQRDDGAVSHNMAAINPQLRSPKRDVVAYTHGHWNVDTYVNGIAESIPDGIPDGDIKVGDTVRVPVVYCEKPFFPNVEFMQKSTTAKPLNSKTVTANAIESAESSQAKIFSEAKTEGGSTAAVALAALTLVVATTLVSSRSATRSHPIPSYVSKADETITVPKKSNVQIQLAKFQRASPVSNSILKYTDDEPDYEFIEQRSGKSPNLSASAINSDSHLAKILTDYSARKNCGSPFAYAMTISQLCSIHNITPRLLYKYIDRMEIEKRSQSNQKLRIDLSMAASRAYNDGQTIRNIAKNLRLSKTSVHRYIKATYKTMQIPTFHPLKEYLVVGKIA